MHIFGLDAVALIGMQCSCLFSKPTSFSSNKNIFQVQLHSLDLSILNILILPPHSRVLLFIFQGFFLLISMLAQICRFVSSSHGCSPTINSLRMTTMPNIDFQQVYIVRVCVKCRAKSLPHSVCVCAMLLCHAKVLANTELWQICAAR
jgi:hypothetical protein